MKYESLTRIYYKHPQDYEETYNKRYNFDLTRHFKILIRQYNHQKSYLSFLCYTEDIVLLLEQIYKEYECLLEIIDDVPPIIHHQFSLLCIVDETKSSNDIEGVQSTRKEIRDILDGHAPGNRLKSIVKKYESILSNEQMSFYSCVDIRKFYDVFAYEDVLRDNPSNKLDGELFRKEPVDVTSTTGKTIHRGVYPESRIIENLQLAIDVLHDENIPFLIRNAIFHYFFAYIHPFYDGNGRTARFISSYYISKNFHPFVALRLSAIIKKQKSKYYNLFSETDSEINRGDLTNFVLGFLSVCVDVIKDVSNILQRKNEQLKKYEEKLKTICNNNKQLWQIYYILLQASLFYGQGITIKEIIEITKKSRGTVQKLLDFIPREYIVINGSNKFYYKLNMSIFRKK